MGLPDGWEEVPAVTLAACEARAVRRVCPDQPWGQTVIQFERAVTADHVTLFFADLVGTEISSPDRAAKAIRAYSIGADFTLADLLAFQRVIGTLITEMQAEREGNGS